MSEPPRRWTRYGLNAAARIAPFTPSSAIASAPMQQMLGAALVTAAAATPNRDLAWNRCLLIEARSRRAAREFRDVFGERLRREPDPFREGQVRVEGRSEVLDGQPILDRERRLGNHLARFGRQNVRPDDLPGRAICDQLHEPAGVARRERARHVL